MKNTRIKKRKGSAKAFIVKSQQKEDTSFLSETSRKDITQDVIKEIGPGIQESVTNQIAKLRENITSNSVSTLGVFASIVTFLLIEIQILKNICDYWRLLGFSSFVLGGLLSFIVILHYVSSFESSPVKIKRLVFLITVVISLLTFAGYCMFKATDEYTCKLTNLNEEFDRLKGKMEQREFDRYLELNDRIDLLEREIKSLGK